MGGDPTSVLARALSFGVSGRRALEGPRARAVGDSGGASSARGSGRGWVEAACARDLQWMGGSTAEM